MEVLGVPPLTAWPDDLELAGCACLGGDITCSWASSSLRAWKASLGPLPIRTPTHQPWPPQPPREGEGPEGWLHGAPDVRDRCWGRVGRAGPFSRRLKPSPSLHAGQSHVSRFCVSLLMVHWADVTRELVRHLQGVCSWSEDLPELESWHWQSTRPRDSGQVTSPFLSPIFLSSQRGSVKRCAVRGLVHAAGQLHRYLLLRPLDRPCSFNSAPCLCLTF